LCHFGDRFIEIYGIKLIGVNLHTFAKFVFTIVLLAIFLGARMLLKAMAQAIFSRYREQRIRFWTRQGVDVVTTVILIVGLISIWFDNPANLATGVGLATAGLAFALQKVITSLAGYLVILRGKTFNVGDRITMGGVRGDVVALGFIQTTIMEMGQPPSVQGADPTIWVSGRQFTGRIVTVTNSKVFEDPVYNYSRDFPLIWEEMHVPVTYACDRGLAERILLEAAIAHTRETTELGRSAIAEVMRRFPVESADLEPRVFYRITDNWLELGLRFLSPAHGARALKDRMSRDILQAFDEAGIGIASATYDIVGLPAIRVVDSTPKAAPAKTSEDDR
jgi:small-conductance mechanosensitive channel